MEASSNIPGAAPARPAAAAAGTLQASFRDTLMGGQKGNMNLLAVRGLAWRCQLRLPTSDCSLQRSSSTVVCSSGLTAGCCVRPVQLRNRAEDLRRSIERIIHTLEFAADRVQW